MNSKKQDEVKVDKAKLQSQLGELAELAASPEARTDHLVDMINRHSGLAETIVNRANSTEFALRHQISRVEHAIAVLGQRRIVDTIKKFEMASRTASVPAPHFQTNPDVTSVATPDQTV
jgi:HD-like signal output (HDOD) protein